MRKSVKILIIVLVVVVLGTTGFLCYRVIIEKPVDYRDYTPNKIRAERAAEFQKSIAERDKKMEELLKSQEKYGGFTKKDFADVIEPRWKRTVGSYVDITPEEVRRVEELTKKQLETLYRKQWREYGDINVSRAIKEFLDSNNYKRPGWVVWVFIDEDRDIGFVPEIVFETKEGRLKVHRLSTLDF